MKESRGQTDKSLVDNSKLQIYGAVQDVADGSEINTSSALSRRGISNGECLLLTLYQDLGDFGVTGAESTVDLEAVCVVEEGASQREKDFL